ncbi:hypothetical protein [Microbispora sp. NPDC049125]|uniref:hypothetical protein n=1 Tax=Microbispora sp. NPDC049125 TaxID=3154929 RepID=UPI0034663237
MTAQIADQDWQDLLAQMTARGTEDGKNAASWWQQDALGGRATGDTRTAARRILKGIEDGDPQILDELPAADLSGQWADGTTEQSLYDDAKQPEWPTYHDLDDDSSEIGDAYRDAYDQAVVDEVTRYCRDELS